MRGDVTCDFSGLLDGHVVRVRQHTWRVRPVGSAIEPHGFHEIRVLLDGAPSYLVALCISEGVHRQEGGRVDWLLGALVDWLERPDKFDGDIIDLVA